MDELDRQSTVFSLLELQAEKHPKSIAIESPGRYPLSYAGLLRLTKQIIYSIRLANISYTDRVAVIMPNSPELAVVLLAVSSSATCVPLNPDYQLDEFKQLFNELDINTVVIAAGRRDYAKKAARESGIQIMELPISLYPEQQKYFKHNFRLFSQQTVPSEHYIAPEDSKFDEQQYNNMVKVLPCENDIALLLHTTGTTSKPKIVELSHKNILEAAHNICHSLALDSIDKCMAMMPQFHIGGVVDTLLAPIVTGGTTIINSRFEASLFFNYLPKHQPTWFQAVPTMLHELLNYAKKNSLPNINPPLRLIRSVSAPLPEPLMRELETFFTIPVIEIYGMTEAGPLIASNPLPPMARKANSVGKPCGPEVKILDSNNEFVATEQLGEVVIKGSSVFSGYEKEASANAKWFHQNWFRTGDLGYFDKDGYLYLQGRVKEVINRGGEKISPFEVDKAMREHASVADAVSFPIPHRSLGEGVAALVVLKANEKLSEMELQSYLSSKIMAFKIPQRILFIEELPESATGKIKRHSLAQELGLDFSAEYVAPTTPTEIKLTKMWAEVLNLEQIGVNDNFFDLGGHSLSGVQLIEAIGEQYGYRINKKALMELSTVKIMSGKIDNAKSNPDFSNTNNENFSSQEHRLDTIKMALASSRCPRLSEDSLFLKQNIDGELPPLFWCFNRPDQEMINFSGRLGSNQPVIGFYSGMALFDGTPEAISQTADFYLDAIVELSEGKPILLGGHCRGASVALEIATKLQQRGISNVHLLLMEYFDPKCFYYPDHFTLLYGRHSRIQGQEEFNHGAIGWRERFHTAPTVTFMDGHHGTYWAKPYIVGFVEQVQNFINRALSIKQ